MEVPTGCEESEDLGADPILVEGQEFLQDYVFAELVDIELDEGRDLAFVAGQGGLMSIDISDVSAPEFLDVVTASGPFLERFYRLELVGDDAVFASNRDYGLAVYDVSDATAMEEMFVAYTEDYSGMAAGDDVLWITSHIGELYTYDVTDPFKPFMYDHIDGLGNPWEPKRLGDRLYVADHTLGVVVVDVTDQTKPVVGEAVEASGGVQDIAFDALGSTMYAAIGGGGVEIFSLDDPDVPESLGTISLDYSVISVAVDDAVLWAANQQDIVALDISDPRSPTIINTEQTEQWAMHVTAGSGYAFVADWAYLGIYSLDPDVIAPDLNPSSTQLYLSGDDETATVALHNLGSDTLEIYGASASDDSLTIRATQLSIEPGGEALVQVEGDGSVEDLVAEVCISTNDPDEPTQTIDVVGGSGAGDNGLGSEAIDFSLTDLDGETHVLSEQQGRPVVLIYFATW